MRNALPWGPFAVCFCIGSLVLAHGLNAYGEMCLHSITETEPDLYRIEILDPHLELVTLNRIPAQHVPFFTDDDFPRCDVITNA